LENKIFKQRSTKEKQRHLASVLKRRTNGALDEEMIRYILHSVSIERQYRILTFSDCTMFREAVARSEDKHTLRTTVLVPCESGTAAAVIVSGLLHDAEQGKKAIYIYAPGLPAGKDSVYAKRY
jgi:hypothetical protein